MARHIQNERPRPDDNMEFTSLDKVSNEQWDRYASGSSRSSIYHLSPWSRLIKKLFGHESHYIAALENGTICGILPLVRLKSVIFGDFMISMPYFNYGGAIGNSKEIEEGLMDYAREMGRELKLDHIEFRDLRERSDIPVRTDKVCMHLKLPGSEDELWRSFPSKLRSQVRRPKKEGVETVVGSDELVDDFFQIFSRNMRDLGTPVYPIGFFREIISTFREHVAIVVVYHHHRPVAGAFLIGFKGMLEIPWASSLREYNRISVNMALYWKVLRYAIENGYHTFDFGRSTKGSGTYKFKKQWGAVEKQLYWYYWINGEAGTLPELNPRNPKYQLAIQAWKRLPVPVANYLGPMIVKNLP